MKTATRSPLGLSLLVLVSACSTPQMQTPNPCETVLCGAGRCAVLEDGVPACICSPGFVASGLTCVSAPNPDLCASNPCSNLRDSLCIVTAGVIDCVCSDTRIEVGGACVLRTPCVPNPCSRVHRTTCQVIGGAAACICDPGFAPEGDGCSLNPVWTCSAQHTDGDLAEPDECPTLAKPLTISFDDARTLDGAGDHDWFKLATTPGRLFTVSVAASMPVLIEIYDSTGITLLASDNHGLSQASVSFVAPSTEALARVRALRANDTGNYLIRYDEIGIDDYANDPASALTLVAGAQFSGAVQYADDLDVVLIEMPAQTAVRFAIADGGSSELVVDISRGDAGRSLRAGDQTIISFPSFGTLTLTARANNRRDELDFVVITESLGPDDHSDDPLFGTTLPTSGLSLPGVLARDGGDVDTFRMSQVDGHIYRARWIIPGGGSSGLVGTVIDGNGVRTSSSFGDALVWESPNAETATLSIGRSWSGFGNVLYGVSVEDLGVDDHGDSIQDATAIVGSAGSGRIERFGDFDVFSFNAVAGHIVQVQLGSTSGFSLSASLLNPSGALIANSSSGSGNSFGGLIATGGTHYLQLASSFSSSSDVLPYTFTVTDRGVDDHADTAANATALTLGTARAGDLQYQADVDVFSFTGVPNHVYQVTCAASFTCNVSIRDPNGQVLGNTFPPISFIATTPGTYVVEVRASFNGGPYTLTVTDQGAEDHGGTPATATALTVGTPIAGRIASSQDLDYFVFTAVPGRVYAATATPSQPRLEARNASNVVIASNYSPLSFVATTATTYIVVSNFSSGTYSLDVADRGPDDHGNTAATATALTLGTPRAGSIQYQNDADVFTVPVVANHHHTVSCVAMSPGSCSISVTTPTGTVIASAFQSQNAVTSFKASASLTNAIVTMTGYDGTNFTVTVTDAGADDHGDDRATATTLTTNGGAQSGVLETGSDVDAFLISTTAGEIVQLASANVLLVVRNPSDQTMFQYENAGAVNVGFISPSGGNWVVLVRQRFSSSASTPYTLTATRGVDDFTTTTPMTLGVPRTGNLDYSGDTDVFSISLTSGTTYNTVISNGARGEIRNPTGSYVGTIYSFSSTFNPTISGTYTITVRDDFSQASSIPYTLTIQ
ncbi:MAG: hypothetical protein JNM17_08220 [Archangium sp.]|nr:hypothetical protein [Archangium sp.]